MSWSGSSNRFLDNGLYLSQRLQHVSTDLLNCNNGVIILHYFIQVECYCALCARTCKKNNIGLSHLFSIALRHRWLRHRRAYRFRSVIVLSFGFPTLSLTIEQIVIPPPTKKINISQTDHNRISCVAIFSAQQKFSKNVCSSHLRH